MEVKLILDYIDKLFNEKLELVHLLAEEKSKSQAIIYRSVDIDLLATALAVAQGEFKIAGLRKKNPYLQSPYADLMEVVTVSRPALSKNGLSVIQNFITYTTGETYLHTVVLHSSGQYIESRVRSVPPKNDIQSIGSYNASLKRMAYASLVGVVSDNEDDDGEAAVATMRETFAKGTALNHKYNARENNPDIISKEQLEELEYELADWPDVAEMVLDGLRIQSLADMPKSKYRASIERVRQIKGTREGKIKIEDFKK